MTTPATLAGMQLGSQWMSAKRAFEAYLDMAVAELKEVSPFNITRAYTNLQANLKNAFGMVQVSNEAIRLLGPIDREFRAIALEFDGFPGAAMGQQSAEKVLRLLEAIEALRVELRACPASDMAKCLGLD